ncbi:hypothetical protein ACE10Z_36200 [Bradyrhizobium sp. Pha-3]|uniref:hypothetical protein n=1 Tax=Bradyrhizobium sp. Pha-3 TaxID=208375 RepID=UPI0035D3FC40
MNANITEDEKRERRARPEPGLGQISGGGADDVGEPAAVAPSIPLVLPEWQKSIEATGHLFATALKDVLSLAASTLHDQATFLRNLAHSKTPAELLKCHLDFAEKFWSKSFSEGSKILDHLKPPPSSAVRQAPHDA